jgi:hypothetical protein
MTGPAARVLHYGHGRETGTRHNRQELDMTTNRDAYAENRERRAISARAQMEDARSELLAAAAANLPAAMLERAAAQYRAAFKTWIDAETAR